VATPDLSFPDAYRQSARRSRARRETAARRRRLLRGGRGGLAVLVGALALAAGVAVAQEPAPAPEGGDAPAEAIEPGDEGKDVKALQRALKIRPDGEYGRKTKRAVRRFQRKEGLKADGVAGPETLQALGISPAGEEDAPTSGDSGGVGSDEHLAQIRECESGGDYTANTGNGFYGAYQFTKESWEQMGGTGMPHEAPPEEQDRLAKKLMEEQGPQAWPNCA
jgi:peptidoglycan hydrolase-like protein with peptidoglycan-binding domain